MRKVLVVSPHSDDETLGAGGTLLFYKKKGYQIYWLNFTSVKKEYGYTYEQELERSIQIKKIIESYPFDGYYCLDIKPANIEQYELSSIISRVSKIVSEIRPEVVILPYPYDAHSDHYFVYKIMQACTKTFRYPFVKKIMCMEIVSETEFGDIMHPFVPNYFVDITEYLEKKIQLFSTYDSEISIHPFPRSEEHIRALATHRGAMISSQYAEAFWLVKNIEK